MALSFLKNLFASKAKEPDFKQMIWSTNDGKLKALVEQIQQHTSAGKPVLVFAWFPSTLEALNYLLTNLNLPFANGLAEGNSQLTLELAEKYLNRLPNPKSLAEGTAILVAEHYPIHEPEVALFEKLEREEPGTTPTVYSSLDEPLFNAFGGDRIKQMMESLGFGKDEAMEHNMIKSSVEKAQAKVSETVTSEQKAKSAEEWFTLNYKTPM